MLKVFDLKLAIDNGLLPEGTKWYFENWEKGKVIESNGKEFYWDWDHEMRTDCRERGKTRSDVWRFREETNTSCWYGMSNGGKQKLGEKGSKSEEPTFVFWATREMVWL